MEDRVSVLITGPCQAFPDEPVVYSVSVLPSAADLQQRSAQVDDPARLAWAEASHLAAAEQQAAAWVEQYAAVLVTAVQPVTGVAVVAMGGYAVVTLEGPGGRVLAAFTALTPEEAEAHVAALTAQFPTTAHPAQSVAPRHVPLGQVAITHAAHDVLQRSRKDARMFLQRHVRGDWGDLSPADAQANDHALQHGGRLLSAYALADAETLWIITEADRSATTLLLPSDY